MKFTYQWLKEFFSGLTIAPDALADRLTMAGIEVKSAEKAGADTVFEVEITSNRPDWLSVVGIAREVAALTGTSIRPPKTAAVHKKPDPAHKGFKISIQDKKDCPLYNASIITGVKIAPSPAWLKSRLESIGCRSINNVVDVTNYCMYTWGQPLHAFDLDTLAPGGIGVRRAQPSEKLVTIDGQERALDKGVLVIADSQRAVALAGVMGGKDTEVGDQTVNILLEAAIFDPLVVRQGRRSLGIQSDASYRFERTVDIHSTEDVVMRALSLIQQTAGGVCVFSQGSSRIAPQKKTVSLDITRARSVLGIDAIALPQAKKYLQALGFAPQQRTKTTLTVGIPSFRPDVSVEADLVEEIARVHGYAAIPTTLPSVKPQAAGIDTRARVCAIKEILVSLGLQEVITYSFLARDSLKGFEESGQGVEVENPLSKEQEVLRPTLLPGLLKCVATNLNQKKEYIALFEAADVFIQPGHNGVPAEELRLGIVLCGERLLWLSDHPAKDKPGFLHLKGITEKIFEELGISSYSFRPAMQPNQFDVFANDKKIGVFAKLARPLLEEREIKNKDVFSLEIGLDKIVSCAKPVKKYAPLPKFPYIQRDISLAIKEGTALEEVYAVITQEGRGLLQEAPAAIDYYKGGHIERGYKGLTVSCRYASGERTLTEAEINPVHESIMRTLTEKLGAKIR